LGGKGAPRDFGGKMGKISTPITIVQGLVNLGIFSRCTAECLGNPNLY